MPPPWTSSSSLWLCNSVSAPPFFSPHLALYTKLSLSLANSWLMHCFINLPKGPLLSIPNPNNLPRDGHGRTSYLSSLLPGALCNICCILPFLVVPRIFLLFMFILCSLHPPNNVSFAFDKKDHGGWKFATLLSLDNEREEFLKLASKRCFFIISKLFDSTPSLFPFFMTSKAS